jgi:hypothetical protein
MMRSLAFLTVFLMSLASSYSQNITATTPARLQVYVTGPGVQQALMTSDRLTVSYDNLKMTGELMLNTLVTDDDGLRELVDSAMYDRISFNGTIPEGQFVFQSTMNNRFSVETDLIYGDRINRILLNFDISNRKTTSANTFDITCTGEVSLINDLGISRATGLDDKVSFQFFQNVQSKTY